MAPSEKQRRAMENVLENGGNVSKAMRDAGYSDATAHSTDKLVRSKGWQELLEEYCPDDTLLQKIQEGLNAVKRVEGDFDPDYAVRHKYVDTIAKLKDKYPAKRTDITSDGERIAILPPELIEKNDTSSSSE